MRALNNAISLTLALTVLTSSLSAYGVGEICKYAFLEPSERSVLSNSITVKEYLAKLGKLKSETEIEQLKSGDKALYLTLLNLDYERAQEIIRLFATFPILTSRGVKSDFRRAANMSESNLSKIETFLEVNRTSERTLIAQKLATTIVTLLGAQDPSKEFALREAREPDTTKELTLFLSQKAMLSEFGVPPTMMREIAQFFNSVKVGTKEFDFIVALIFHNFDSIAKASITDFNPSTKAIISITGLASIISLQLFGLTFEIFSSGIGLGSSFGSGFVITAFTTLIGAAALTSIPEKMLAKISAFDWVEKTRARIISKKQEKQIQQQMLVLSGLDPQSIKPLPTVQQLEKNPKGKTAFALPPALQNSGEIAYPEVDLARLENSLEKQISLADLEGLNPHIDNVSKLKSNPFLIHSFGSELSGPQILIIGREEILSQQFNEINERLTFWQAKQRQAKSEQEKSWVILEHVKISTLLDSYLKESATSWEYLGALKKAIIRYETYFSKEIAPHMTGDMDLSVGVVEEALKLSLIQVEVKIQSLRDRAIGLGRLASALKN